MSNKSDTVLLHSTIKATRQVHQSQIGKLQIRSDEDITLFETFREYAKRRAEIEQEYAQKLEKLSKALASRKSVVGKEKGTGGTAAASSAPNLASSGSALPSPTSPSVTDVEQSQSLPVPSSPAVASASKRRTTQAFQALLAETEKQAKSRLLISEKFNADFADVIRNFNKEKAASFKKQAEHIVTLQEDMWKALAELEKTRKAYEEAERLAEQAKAKYDNEVKRPNSTLKTLTNIVKNRDAVTHSENLLKKCNGATKRLNIARNEYLLQLDAVNAQTSHYYSMGLPAAMRRIDGSYYTSFASLLQRITNLETDHSKTMIEDMQNLSATAAKINRDEEAEMFLNDQKAILGKSKAFSFDAVGSDEINDIVIDEFSKIVLAQKLGLLVVQQSALQSRLAQNEKEKQGLKQMAEVYQTSSELGDAGNPIEKLLDMEQICDLIRSELARIQVQVERIKLHGVEPAVPEGAVLEAMLPEGVKGTAILDYEPLAEGEVALAKGAKVLILEHEQGGWIKIDNNGTVGIVPATYVKTDDAAESIQSSSQATAAPPAIVQRVSTGGEEVKALYDYAGNPATGELSFKAGDVVEVHSRDANTEGDSQEWWSGICLRTGQSGHFPSMFVEAKEKTIQAGMIRSSSKAESQYSSQRRVMKALYDYDESCPGELTFRRGELIEVLDTTISADWWEGRNMGTGACGQFPTAYVEDASGISAPNSADVSGGALSDALTSTATNPPVAIVKAVYDYDAQATEELSFRRGDTVNIISKTVPGDDTGGWWVGEKDGKQGQIPASYVE